jgi:hypothetical protein
VLKEFLFFFHLVNSLSICHTALMPTCKFLPSLAAFAGRWRTRCVLN